MWDEDDIEDVSSGSDDSDDSDDVKVGDRRGGMLGSFMKKEKSKRRNLVRTGICFSSW
jgi:hypothetical protein